MKRFVCYLVAVFSIIFFASCEKSSISTVDDADYFVGTYDVYVTTVWEWIGYDKTDMYMDKEVIEISKISPNKVKIVGGINIIKATAVVYGKTLFIDEHWNDAATFTPSKHVMDGIFELSETYLMEGPPPCLTTKHYTACKR